jgi:16S rRNA (cytidine1402-2'-O)-methyltransferase
VTSFGWEGFPADSGIAPTVGTLYVIGIPFDDADDITLRARRVLGEVAFVAGDGTSIEHLLACHKPDLPHEVLSVPAPRDTINRILDKLEGSDAAVLCEGAYVGLSGPSQALICAAIERGYPVVPVPGPSFPLTALVVSGLPADSFVYLGQLPQQPAARHSLLASVAAARRTLVALELPDRLPMTLTDLEAVLGDRPLVVVAPSEGGESAVWRGTTTNLSEFPKYQAIEGPCCLVIEGMRGKVAPWDEGRLRAEIQIRLNQGLGAKETSQALATESGWPRREIYRLAADADRLPASE